MCSIRVAIKLSSKKYNMAALAGIETSNRNKTKAEKASCVDSLKVIDQAQNLLVRVVVRT